MVSLFFTFVLVFSLVSVTCNATPVSKYPAIFVFGDSTVDPGNNNYITTILRANHKPYGRDFPTHVPTGRFTNGRMVTDFLASSLGIKELVPPYLDPTLSNEDLRTGVSFASAGSGLDDMTNVAIGVIPVSKQPRLFKEYKEKLIKVVGETEANSIIGGALVMISAGTNDIIFSFYDSFVRRVEFNMGRYQDFLLQKLHDRIKELYDLGCRTFVLPSLAPIGCLPIQMTAKFENSSARTCVEKENADARSYNSKLEKLLPEIQVSLSGSKLIYASMYDPVIDIINNPQKYGFLVTNRGCCGSGLVEMGPLCNVASSVCKNSTQYLFWDSVHPSQATYSVIAKVLADKFIA
ncbi:hypothetical protein GIB67_020288 [Kingdonia uniflora]|uniref:GDSL esterase/lipase n=1 Tax=Kingdonia uniflora TaxID=39325 RepID=A0A7J7P3T0_9MAGN|nr:hypothetical protein GIB67_020288 [Kingdonia uniflora]